MPSIVYVLTNSSMPGVVKIGKTSRDIPIRMNELYTTGVPQPFECAFAIEVDDGQALALEMALHRAFRPSRRNLGREFFEIAPSQVKAILSVWPGGKDVTSDITLQFKMELGNRQSPDAKVFKGTSSNPNFSEIGIPIGSFLKCAEPGREAIVTGDEKVTFFGDGSSLQEATKAEIGAQGLALTVQNPVSQWMFDGQYLSDICEETYGGHQ